MPLAACVEKFGELMLNLRHISFPISPGGGGGGGETRPRHLPLPG